MNEAICLTRRAVVKIVPVPSFVREHTRYPVELAVRMRCSSWSDYLELHTSNLSRGGLFVGTAVTAPVGTEIAIELTLPTGATVKLRGEVAHVNEAAPGQPAGMGVMFYDLEPEARRALDQALQQARAATAKPKAAPLPPPPPPAAMKPPVKPVPTPPPPTAATPTAATGERAPTFSDAIEQALLDELARRLDLAPHAQLGVSLQAGDAEIEEAYERLRQRYAPTIFARYGAATGAVVKSINECIETAHQRLMDASQRRALIVEAAQPRAKELTPDELEQKRRGEAARAALRAGIERRVEEACAHRDLGRVDEAITAFENVLTLDRKNDFAREELRKLRDVKAKKRR